MGDDIDDLLNEVENKYCASNQSKAQKTQSGKAKAGASHSVNTKGREELTAMIDDIFDDGPEPVCEGPNSGSSSGSGMSTKRSTSLHSTTGSKKCFPVHIGGTSCSQGLSTTVNKRACDRLRCTECDFHISSFENFQWDHSVDYLFLRNNMPDFGRLKSKLIPRRGSRAYACQCKWMSVRDLLDLQHENNLNMKWVCGKH